jgi:hypothetical protein
MAPRILYPGGYQRVNRFAFVIHPLSQEYFKKVKPIELLSRVSPPLLMDSLEKVMAYAPPFVYSKVSGIQSPTGVRAEGWLISVGGTPREIMAPQPGVHLPPAAGRGRDGQASWARRSWAWAPSPRWWAMPASRWPSARRCPSPPATATAHRVRCGPRTTPCCAWACCRRPQGKERVAFKAMVVGATGSHRLGLRAAAGARGRRGDLVSPETAKLLALKESILQQTPDAKVVLSARADTRIGEMDMIVTATSGAGKKVLDIMKVKPGCVITDVARPLDLPAEEVAKRPDVLVIESARSCCPATCNEEHRPAPERGLCLPGRDHRAGAGRTLRELHRGPPDRVGEGARDLPIGPEARHALAAISGVNGVFSDEDIARVRELALQARAATQPKPAPRRRAPAKAPRPKRAAVSAGA